MLRALFLLLSCATDCEIIADLAHRTLVMALVNVGALGCIGVRIAIGHWLAKHSEPIAPHDAWNEGRRR